jgi:hypothetical protein
MLKRMTSRFAAAALVALSLVAAQPVLAQQAPPDNSFSGAELIDTGHQFFGQISSGLASAIEQAVARNGQPNGYILGQEGSGAIFGGLRYGEGMLYTRNAGTHPVYWQGPTLGLDLGGDGSRTMMLVYNLPSIEAMYTRFGGVDGSAYLVGGFSVTYLGAGQTTLVPISSGLGGRLGVNVGYLKFTREPTWNPF